MNLGRFWLDLLYFLVKRTNWLLIPALGKIFSEPTQTLPFLFAVSSLAPFSLLDLNRALRHSLALGQRHLEYAILQLGLAVGRVGVGRQLEAAVDLDVGIGREEEGSELCKTLFSFADISSS